MHGLPKEFDATIFVGQELIQVCFTRNNIGFSFSSDILITLESSFVYRSATTKAEVKQTVPVFSSNLMQLTGKKVNLATADPNGTLVLQFENGDKLTLLDDSRTYESYSIRIGDKEIFV